MECIFLQTVRGAFFRFRFVSSTTYYCYTSTTTNAVFLILCSEVQNRTKKMETPYKFQTTPAVVEIMFADKVSHAICFTL